MCILSIYIYIVRRTFATLPLLEVGTREPVILASKYISGERAREYVPITSINFTRPLGKHRPRYFPQRGSSSQSLAINSH